MPKRYTQRDTAKFIQAFAPEGAKLPDWVNKSATRKVTTKRGHPEDDLQMECVGFLEKLPATLFWSTPNHIWLGEGDRGKQAYYMDKQKRMGLNPGATDLNILFRNTDGAPTLCLPELKIGYNKPSPQQESFMDQANCYGAYTGVVKSVEDLKNLLRLAKHPCFVG